MQNLGKWQGSGLQCAYSAVVLALQGFPPRLASMMTALFRTISPPPQETGQRVKALQSPHVQSTGSSPGHGSALQGVVACREPSQGLPTPLACCAIWRDDLCCPPPQESEQAETCDQALSWQSFASLGVLLHLSSAPPVRLQGWAAREAPWQSSPPALAAIAMLRDRSWCPAHTSLQELQAVQPDHWQLTTLGQRLLVQLRISSTSPSQGFPPYAASASTWRVLADWPWPQGEEQRDHSAQVDQAQSCFGIPVCSQASMAQAPRSSSGAALHWLPPCAACTTFRERVRSPPSQDLEHCAQGCQSAYLQSSAVPHTSVLHAEMASKLPAQATPCSRACLNMLRVW